MVKVHELKINPEYFSAIKDGRKRFELRYDDRNFRVGDVLILKEWNGDFTGKSLECDVKYILKNFDGLCDGYIIISLSDIRNHKYTND